APNMSQAERDRIGSLIVQGLKEFPGVAAVSPPIHNQDGELTIVQVTPTSGPASQQTEDLVNTLRDRAKVVHAKTGVDPYITGTTALNIDTSRQLSNALPGYVLVVVGLALLLLTVVFRSILVPITAAAGFLLTIAAAMGITVWIFQHGHLGDLLSVPQAGAPISLPPPLPIGVPVGLPPDFHGVFVFPRPQAAV